MESYQVTKQSNKMCCSHSPATFLHTDVLFHIWNKDGRGHRATRTQVQLAIPQLLVKTVLGVNHDSLVFGGHYGLNRTGTHPLEVLLTNHEQRCPLGSIVHQMQAKEFVCQSLGSPTQAQELFTLVLCLSGTACRCLSIQPFWLLPSKNR